MFSLHAEVEDRHGKPGYQCADTDSTGQPPNFRFHSGKPSWLLQTVTKRQLAVARSLVMLTGMQARSRQLLSIILTVLLVLSPLGSAFAAVTSLDLESGDVNLHVMHQVNPDTSNNSAAPVECDHCASDCSGQGNCASGSCGGCFVTIEGASIAAISHPAVVYTSLDGLSVFSYDVSSTFRPPRA